MKRILCFDCSQEQLVVAAGSGGRVIASETRSTVLRHSAELVPALERVLRKAAWGRDRVDVLAVGVGPGSFTGIRVGISTAQMLSLAWDVPLVPVSSLEVTARSAKESGVVAAALDARRGLVYGAVYSFTKDRSRLLRRPTLSSPEIFLKAARSAKRIVGSAAIAQRVELREEAYLQAAEEALRRGHAVTAEDLKPLYLHPKDCNVTIKK